jgi:hypothetical protein
MFLQVDSNAVGFDISLMVGDFTTYGTPHGTPHAQADELIETMAKARMGLLIPAGTITYPKSETPKLNLVEAPSNQQNSQIWRQRHHLPIETILNLKPEDDDEVNEFQPYNLGKLIGTSLKRDKIPQPIYHAMLPSTLRTAIKATVNPLL